jgi:CspA family cold shock protein
MSTGKVDWFNAQKGYGFIAVDGASEGQPAEKLFVHFSQVAAALKAASLKDEDFSVGRSVSFDRVVDDKGPRPRAENLRIL